MAPPPLVHPTAVVAAEAVLADDVRVGPYTVIDGAVSVGPGTVIGPRAHLIGPLVLGRGNEVGAGTVLGGRPQHLGYKGESTRTVIGDYNVFHEHVTVNRGMPTGRGETTVGSHNYFMANSHVGHDARVGDHCILVNGALLGGHVELGDRAFVSGNAAVHQFCRVGRLAFLGGVTGTTMDVPPFWMMRNNNEVRGVNVIGMRRAGVAAAEVLAVRRAFAVLYRQKLPITAALARIEAESGDVPAVRELVAFVRSSKRGIPGPAHYVGNADDEARAA